jgi:hypothetical protein
MKGWRNHFRDKASLLRDRRWLRRLTNVKTWQLLIVLLVFVMLTAIFLRLNNLNMVEYRAALTAADKTGDIAKVQTAAKNLQNYVAHHMNTSTGRTALQSLYDQAAKATIEASRPPEIPVDVHARAQEECMPNFRRYGYVAWTNCVSEKVGVNSITDLNQNQQPPPSADAYYVEYASARWSFDLAGISLLICLLLAFAIVLRLVLTIILRITLKLKYRSE